MEVLKLGRGGSSSNTKFPMFSYLAFGVFAKSLCKYGIMMGLNIIGDKHLLLSKKMNPLVYFNISIFLNIF